MAAADRYGPEGRPLTSFEHILLGTIAAEPRSGYQLKKVFSSSPSSVYQPSPGALYPALRRLEARDLLRAERISSGRRDQRQYHVTAAGHAVHLDWLRQPVVPGRIGHDLGLYLMRFALMENRLPRPDVLAFLADLAAALEGFVTGLEHFLAAGALTGRLIPELAVEHGLAVHRASLEWARTAHKTLNDQA
jgi:PadR family transcriptional regulator AphA